MNPSILKPHKYPNFSPTDKGQYLVINKNNDTYILSWDTFKWSTDDEIMYFYTPVLSDNSTKPKVSYVDNRISYYGC
jgi:hypothetical protein